MALKEVFTRLEQVQQQTGNETIYDKVEDDFVAYTEPDLNVTQEINISGDIHSGHLKIPLDSPQEENAVTLDSNNEGVSPDSSGIDMKAINEVTDDHDAWKIASDWWYLNMRQRVNVPTLEASQFNTYTVDTHIFDDNYQQLYTKTHKLRTYRGKTIRQGVPHVHPDNCHDYHVPVKGDSVKTQQDLRVLRKNEYDFRKLRKSKL